MRVFAIILFCSLVSSLSAQSDTTSITDILRAPVSPAFQLLGNNPSEIERPTTPTDFIASLAQSTNNFTSIPANLSVVISPKWLFDTKQNRNNFQNFKKDSNVGNNILQSLVFSMGTATYKYDSVTLKYNSSKYYSNATQHTSAAFGFKFSPWRGKVDDKSIQLSESLHKADSLLSTITQTEAIDFTSDPAYQANYKLIQANQFAKKKDTDILSLLDPTATSDSIQTQIKSLQSDLERLKSEREILDAQNLSIKNSSIDKVLTKYKNQIDSVKQLFISGEQEIKRYGFKLDIAGGFVLDFPTQKFDFSKVTKVGLWVTSGWDDKRNWGIIGMFRFSYNPDLLYIDNLDTLHKLNKWTFDLGGKLYIAQIKKLTISAEIIERWYINANTQNTVKYSLTGDYEIAKNKYISLTVGKDFEGPTKTGGNLFAALNTTIGLGSLRPLFSKATNPPQSN